MCRDKRDIKRQLMEVVIRIGAEQGISNVKTRNIEAVSGINQAYIYHHYSGIDALLGEAFVWAEFLLTQSCLRWLSTLEDGTLNKRACHWLYWRRCWDFVVSHPNLCKYCFQFYFSATISDGFIERSKQRIRGILDAVGSCFAENQWEAGNFRHVIDVILLFAVKVVNGELPNDDGTARYVYRIVSATFAPLPESGFAQDVKENERDGQGTEETEQKRAARDVGEDEKGE